MNLKILLFLASSAVFASCSNSYKSTQTPDDVYYSPVRNIEEDSKKEEETKVTRYRSSEDREIIMSKYDRRWRDFDDDFNCHYNPYRYGYNYGYYYNPYYYPAPVYISNTPIRNPKNTTPRMTNLGSYQYSATRYVDPKTGTGQWIYTGRKYNNSNNSNNNRRIITPSYDNNNNSNNRSDNNTRSYTPSTNSSSGGSKSSGTPVSRPGRG